MFIILKLRIVLQVKFLFTKSVLIRTYILCIGVCFMNDVFKMFFTDSFMCYVNIKQILFVYNAMAIRKPSLCSI